MMQQVVVIDLKQCHLVDYYNMPVAPSRGDFFVPFTRGSRPDARKMVHPFWYL